ncbi:MAG: prepilin-type N-terminal cleavage/methylation domain-containing protein [Methylococcales bacterium]
MKQYSFQQGLTLIELIISITILSISLTAIISVFANSSTNSATPMAREQALFIATAYMEEIMLQAYSDPSSETGTCEEGAGNRSLFDDVNDYDCVNDTSGAVDQNGNLISGLGAYNIDVDVTVDTLNGAVAQRIDVTVTRDGLDSINNRLTAYRTIY